MGLPVGQFEGKRVAPLHRCGNLLKLLAESKAAFWMAVNSSVHKPQSDPSFIEGDALYPKPGTVIVNLIGLHAPSAFVNIPGGRNDVRHLKEGARGSGQLARTSDVEGESFLQVKVYPMPRLV
jgi:hypothetical protein